MQFVTNKGRAVDARPEIGLIKELFPNGKAYVPKGRRILP